MGSRLLAGLSPARVGLCRHRSRFPRFVSAAEFGGAAAAQWIGPQIVFVPGTGEGGLACLAENITLGGCQSSIIQQTIGSHFLGALLTKGNQALVPTTSIFTTYDEVIQPEINPVTSQLNGATNVRVQDYCGAGYLVEHTQIPYASYPYYLAVNALTNRARANPAAVPSSLCAWVQSGALLTQFRNGIGLLAEDLTAV